MRGSQGSTPRPPAYPAAGDLRNARRDKIDSSVQMMREVIERSQGARAGPGFEKIVNESVDSYVRLDKIAL
jgi:hypothetical protein